jgi:molybdate transport system substrate-binding protein
VLFGPTLDSVRDGGADLRERDGVRVALANAETAPYGAAAAQVLERLGVTGTLAPRLARGESVAQVEQFVRSGAAELGFVSLAQVVAEPASSYWLVPRELHRPLLQDALLLDAGAPHPAARAYFDFLRSDEARRIIERGGYHTPGGGGA